MPKCAASPTLNREYIAQNLKLVRIQAIFQPTLEVLIGATFLLVLWMGGRDVLRHRISIGSFVMFNTYMGMLIWPMIALGWVVNLMQRGGASLEANQPDSRGDADHSRAARIRCVSRTSPGRSNFAGYRCITARVRCWTA